MRRILLAEDEALLRELASDDLADAGFEVTAVGTGEEARLKLMGGEEFHLLITDIRMPGPTDGWALGSWAHDSLDCLPVIYVTGFTDTIRTLHPQERVLRKPYKLDRLLDAIAELGVTSSDD